jgi:hypothetical protein
MTYVLCLSKERIGNTASSTFWNLTQTGSVCLWLYNSLTLQSGCCVKELKALFYLFVIPRAPYTGGPNNMSKIMHWYTSFLMCKLCKRIN